MSNKDIKDNALIVKVKAEGIEEIKENLKEINQLLDEIIEKYKYIQEVRI